MKNRLYYSFVVAVWILIVTAWALQTKKKLLFLFFPERGRSGVFVICIILVLCVWFGVLLII